MADSNAVPHNLHTTGEGEADVAESLILSGQAERCRFLLQEGWLVVSDTAGFGKRRRR